MAILLLFGKVALHRAVVSSEVFRIGTSNLARRSLHLQQNQAFVNGKWVSAAGGQTFEVKNPANEHVLGAVPDMDVNDVKVAVDAAYEAFYSKAWHASTAKERSALLKVHS